jgi:predicted nicotinamide N-methyase
MRIVRPANFDHLLDRASADPEQNLPYWAEIWPSGVALAAAIAREPELFRGQRVLEIGCGLGVTAVAALRAGAELLVTDYAQEALSLCQLNALAGAGSEPDTMRVNWRKPGGAMPGDAFEPFPVVLAADVLYEIRDLEPLLAFTERAVASRGELWLAEPGRVAATLFTEALLVRGWHDRQVTYEGPWPDPEDNRKHVVVTLHRLCRQP